MFEFNHNRVVAENIFRSFYGIEKGRRGEIGEIRTWNGRQYQKQSDGTWKEVVDKRNHPPKGEEEHNGRKHSEKEKTGKRGNADTDKKGNAGTSGRDEKIQGRFGTFTVHRESDSKSFQDALLNAKSELSEDSRWRVDSSHSLEDYDNDRKYVVNGKSTFAITKDGDIISVAKPKSDKEISGSELLQMAVRKGGRKLDSFDGNYDFYVKNGFEPVSWTRFDEEYAPEGWDKEKHKKENVIFFKYTGKVTNETLDDFYDHVEESEDYDSAMKKRDESIKRR